MPVTPQISAAADLGLGDTSETEEERKKRLKQIEQSSAVKMLFGPGGGDGNY